MDWRKAAIQRKFFNDSADTIIEFAERYIATAVGFIALLSVASGHAKDGKDPVVFAEDSARKQSRHSRVAGGTRPNPQKADANYKATHRHLLMVMVERICNTLQDI